MHRKWTVNMSLKIDMGGEVSGVLWANFRKYGSSEGCCVLTANNWCGQFIPCFSNFQHE